MKCSCGKRAIYHRRWEGRYYCADCLGHQVEKSFKKGLREQGFPRKGRVAVGVSGGKDSMVVLTLAWKFLRHTHEIIPIIIDEGISGYRPASMGTAIQYSRSLGLEPVVGRFSEIMLDLDDMVKKGLREMPCTICGAFRRYLLNRISRENGADVLMTGHNLDDYAGSVMLNFLKNDWGRFVRLGMQEPQEGFVRRVKPLRRVPEKEIVIYANIMGIPYHDDECPYSRDMMRRHVLNAMNDLEMRYPGTKIQIVRFYERLLRSIQTEKGKAGKCRICGEPASADMCRVCELRMKLGLIDH